MMHSQFPILKAKGALSNLVILTYVTVLSLLEMHLGGNVR